MRASDELVEGYRDGFGDDRDILPASLANRSHSYRVGWENGRDDRLRHPRASALLLRMFAANAIAADEATP